MAFPKAAIVVRGVGIRGTGKAEGTVLRIVDRPQSTEEITRQEYHELKATRFIEDYVEPAAKPAAAEEPPKAKK